MLDLHALKEQTLKAKHSHEAHKLEGVARSLTYYMYAEILDGIEWNRFTSIRMSKNPVSARIHFFDVRIEVDRVFVETVCRYNARHIKCFKCKDKAEAESMRQVVFCVVQSMSLKAERVNRYGNDRIEVFKTKENA